MRAQLQAAEILKRPPQKVMKLARMGCFHQTRLSFMRGLLRQLKKDNWTFERARWEVDAKGVGVAVYQANGPSRCYSLVCFAHDLPPEKRSDRVIADQWDATFALFDGIPEEQDIVRMGNNVPLQEAGQASEKELVLSRANRSVRLFAHVVDRLSRGKQPDVEMIESVGYLMRTTAVYGNGKFGLSDRERIADRKEFSSAFRSELLAVWLIRWFTIDIVEHMAKTKNAQRAAPLDLAIKTRLGVGNSTGLGMAPFLVTHPALLHTWINARETALMRVRNLVVAEPEAQACFQRLTSSMRGIVDRWHTDNARQHTRVEKLKGDLDKLEEILGQGILDHEHPWDALILWSEFHLSLEGQELVVSLVIEPYGELVDDLADKMTIDESEFQAIDGCMKVGEAKRQILDRYDWALKMDFSGWKETARFWYVSEEKLEPRLGQRYEEPGAEKEQPLAFARDISALFSELASQNGDTTIAAFLMRYPQHRSAVKRLQLVSRLSYAEIHDNLIDADLMPVDLLRCKLSFFGANKFDPRSDRWVRITMYQDAPYPDSFHQSEADNWAFAEY